MLERIRADLRTLEENINAEHNGGQMLQEMARQYRYLKDKELKLLNNE